MKILLSDLQRLGYHFICNSVIRSSKKKQLVSGELMLNEEFIPVTCLMYSDNRPAVLLDIGGSTEDVAKRNKEKIISFVQRGIEFNINGVRDALILRRNTRIARLFAITLSVIATIYCLMLIFIPGVSNFAFICLFIFLVCLFFCIFYNL